MQASESTDNGRDDETRYETPEFFADGVGTRISLVILCIALFIMIAGAITGPSFGKCSTLDNSAMRDACYDELRSELLKAPAKGPDVPAGQIQIRKLDDL